MIQARTLSAGWLLVGALGCGGGTTSAGGNSASGSVDGVSLPVASGFALVGPSMLSGCYGQTCDPFGDTVEVVLTNTAGLTCSFVASQQNVTFANVAALTLEVGNATPVEPGTYAIDTAGDDAGDGGWPLAAAWFATTTANCGAGLSVRATGGTVTLTTASASHVAGSYTATLAQGTLAGSFDIDVCSLADASIGTEDAGAPQCVQ